MPAKKTSRKPLYYRRAKGIGTVILAPGTERGLVHVSHQSGLQVIKQLAKAGLINLKSAD